MGCGTLKSMTDEQPEKREPEEDPLEAQLREIEERAAKLRGGTKMPDPPEWNYKRPTSHQDQRVEKDSESYRGLGVGLMLAYAMIGPIIVGWGVGWLIDRDTGKNSGQTWGTVIGMFVGFIAIVFLLGRANQSRK